jgi:hypothetical protein
MQSDLPLPPWAALRRSWWVYGLGAALVALHLLSFVVRVRCTVMGRCGPAARLLDPDAVGGVPRLVTAALFVVAAVVSWRACRSGTGRTALWWGAVAAICAALAVLKLVSAHSLAESDSAVLTLVGSVSLAATALAVLLALGRRWRVPGTGAVVFAMALYAAAAIGLDVVTGVVEAAQSHAPALSAAAATFLEESGEAIAALVVVVTVRWRAPAGHRPLDDSAAVQQ